MHHAFTKDGKTPLFAASYRGCVKVVEMLVAAGADVASRQVYVEVVEELVAAGAGATVDQVVTGSCYTPLLIASTCGKVGVVKELIAVGANVDHTSSHG